MRVLLLVAVVVLSLGSVRAQSLLVERPGAIVSLDLAGGPFPMLTPAGVDRSGSLGARLGRGVDVAVTLGYGGAVADTLFPYPAEIHAGLEASLAWAERAPWRVVVGGNVSVSGSDTYIFPDGGGPTVVPDRRSVLERRGRVSVARYLRVTSGRVRVLAGLGLYGSVRHLTSSTLVFRAGGPGELTVGGDTVTESSRGVLLAVPVAVRLGPRADVVLEPELRFNPLLWGLGAGDGQVTVRLNL